MPVNGGPISQVLDCLGTASDCIHNINMQIQPGNYIQDLVKKI